MTNKKIISQTLARHMQSCIEEYELVKRKQSIHFKTVKSFCAYYGFSHQNFMKIYLKTINDVGLPFCVKSNHIFNIL